MNLKRIGRLALSSLCLSASALLLARAAALSSAVPALADTMGVRGGQQDTSCYQNFTNTCPSGPNGDQSSCNKVACVQIAEMPPEEWSCPAMQAFDNDGVDPDYQDAEDNWGSSSGYEGQTSGEEYDCGLVTYCSYGTDGGTDGNGNPIPACTSGSWGSQQRCANYSSPGQFYNVPTSTPDTSSKACSEVTMLLDERLIAVSRINGIEMHHPHVY